MGWKLPSPVCKPQLRSLKQQWATDYSPHSTFLMYWLVLTGHFHRTTYCKFKLLLPNGSNQIRDGVKMTPFLCIFCKLHWNSLGILTAVPLTGSSADLPCQLLPSEPPKQLTAITKYPHVSTVSLFLRVYWTTEILMYFSFQWWAPSLMRTDPRLLTSISYFLIHFLSMEAFLC